MQILQVTALAIVEGLTEFLPISSTAHLILTSKILGLVQTDFIKSFQIIIQLGAILAVVTLYFKELVTNKKLWTKIIAAFIPSAVVGIIFYGIIKDYLLEDSLIIPIALIVGGVVFSLVDRIFSSERSAKDGSDDNLELTISYKTAVLIGLFQPLAMIPGVSRAAAVIFGGFVAGLNKTSAVKFSFFLAIPTMIAATALDMYKTGLNFSPNELSSLALGLILSFLTALMAIKTFIKFVRTKPFWYFGVYRIIVGLLWLYLVK